MGYTLMKPPLIRGCIDKSLKRSKFGVEKSAQVPCIVLERRQSYKAS